MADIDVKKIVQVMLGASAQAIGPEFNATKALIEQQFTTLAQVLVQIQAAKLAGKMTEEECKILMDMQKKAVQSVLATTKGIGEIAAQKALGAALLSVAKSINEALGFNLA